MVVVEDAGGRCQHGLHVALNQVLQVLVEGHHPVLLAGAHGYPSDDGSPCSRTIWTNDLGSLRRAYFVSTGALPYLIIRRNDRTEVFRDRLKEIELAFVACLGEHEPQRWKAKGRAPLIRPLKKVLCLLLATSAKDDSLESALR